MADVQIVNAATSDAASDYVLPASIEFLLKAVRAEFRDNGAGSDWLPAVVVTSDSGHAIATAADQGAKVTAGGDADASFFPGVKSSAGAASALDLPWAYGEADLQTDGTHAAYFTTPISDATIFAYDAFGKRFNILEPGVYLVFHRANIETSAASPAIGVRLSLTDQYTSGAGGNFAGGVLEDPVKPGIAGFSAANKLWNLNAMTVLSIDATQVPVRVFVTAFASDGGNYLLGLNTLLLRTATVGLLNPF